jgi:catechol 2,3-dioxygenase-like lactoylglutathione lyase family enzyme
MTSMLNRRGFLASMPALALVPLVGRSLGGGGRALAQAPAAPPIRVRGLSQMTLTVSDVKKSLDFYQALFGMPIQARHGSTVLLRIGSGPQFVALKPAAAGERPSISAFGMAVEGFNADRVVKILIEHGVTPAESPQGPIGAMKVRMTTRDGTPEIFVGDPSGIVFQLHDVSYCGGSGALGITCRNVEPAPAKGLLAMRDMSHFTIGVADAQRTVAFYQGLFGMPVQVSQGPTPAYAVGPGVHFLMFTGGGGARGAAPGGGRGGAPRGPAIDHACMGMDNFNPETVTKILADFGIKPQQGGQRDPLVTYISMRMPNRGGAENGTPELYLTDPDGLPIQIQDVKYCGGGGFLGDSCP